MTLVPFIRFNCITHWYSVWRAFLFFVRYRYLWCTYRPLTSYCAILAFADFSRPSALSPLQASPHPPAIAVKPPTPSWRSTIALPAVDWLWGTKWRDNGIFWIPYTFDLSGLIRKTLHIWSLKGPRTSPYPGYPLPRNPYILSDWSLEDPGTSPYPVSRGSRYLSLSGL